MKGLIDFGNKINVDEGYVSKKMSILLLLDKIEKHENNWLILWSLDKNCDSQTNKNCFKGIFNTDKFILLPSKLSKPVLNGQTISIKQEELDIIKDAFFKELDSLDYYIVKNLK